MRTNHAKKGSTTEHIARLTEDESPAQKPSRIDRQDCRGGAIEDYYSQDNRDTLYAEHLDLRRGTVARPGSYSPHFYPGIT